MNLILLLFILLASMFLASSVNNLAAITGAVDHFIEISNVPDLFVLALTDGQNDPIRDFLAKNENVKIMKSRILLRFKMIKFRSCSERQRTLRHTKTMRGVIPCLFSR